MKVLQDWDEIGRALNTLREAGLPTHSDPAKCWDLHNIRELFSKQVAKSSRVVDLGCGPTVHGCLTLEFLRSMGYENLLGIDLKVPLYARLATLVRGWQRFRTLSPYRAISADITSTPLEDDSVDAAVLLSVVEHGIDLERLFIELSRILKVGGVVYLSTDYWEEPLERGASKVTSGSHKNEPLPWSIFDYESIRGLLRTADRHGLRAEEDGDIPPCKDRPVFWMGRNYTFIAVELQKVADGLR